MSELENKSIRDSLYGLAQSCKPFSKTAKSIGLDNGQLIIPISETNLHNGTFIVSKYNNLPFLENTEVTWEHLSKAVKAKMNNIITDNNEFVLYKADDGLLVSKCIDVSNDDEERIKICQSILTDISDGILRHLCEIGDNTLKELADYSLEEMSFNLNYPDVAKGEIVNIILTKELIPSLKKVDKVDLFIKPLDYNLWSVVIRSSSEYWSMYSIFTILPF